MDQESKDKLKELMRKHLTEAYKEYLDFLERRESPLCLTSEQIFEVFGEIYNLSLDSPSIRLKKKENKN